MQVAMPTRCHQSHTVDSFTSINMKPVTKPSLFLKARTRDLMASAILAAASCRYLALRHGGNSQFCVGDAPTA